MSHKAGHNFFDVKREWSKRKDTLLEHYVVPYLPKIFTVRKPVLLVDGFAGPGKFADGSDGSPRKLCQFIERASSYKNARPVELWCVERDAKLASQLRANVEKYESFCKVINADFASVIPAIESKIATHSIFLYLDPFTNMGLSWSDMDRVFGAVSKSNSIEVLLNFNVVAFARVACVALGKRFVDVVDYEEIEDDPLLDNFDLDSLDEVMGGSIWQSQFKESPSFPAACNSINSAYMSLLRKRFAEVCAQEIKAKDKHKTPKYLLIFGSRSAEGLGVMNDAMAKSRVEQAAYEESEDAARLGKTLFNNQPESLVPDTQERLPSLILDALGAKKLPRYELVIATIRRAKIGEYSRSDITRRISDMVRSKQLATAANQTRLNDDSVIYAPAG
ncbi:hypothetical protein LBMAG48_03660 [Phycisphaerae bacterium]|nr:hypothetical protein LBMAG48_03660 [Phycisphaerae bacterium]